MGMQFNIAYPMADGGHCQGEVCDCRDIARQADHKYTCQDFDFYEYCDHIEEMCHHNELEVGLSGANGWRILQALGYEPDYCGLVDADDLLGRILTVQAVGPCRPALDVADPATRAIQAALCGGPGSGPKFVDLSPSFDDLVASPRLDHLAALARAAKSIPGAKVGWC